MWSFCASMPACPPPHTHPHTPHPSLLEPIRSPSRAMKTAPSAFFPPQYFQLCNGKEETRKITKTAQNQMEQKEKKRTKSLGAAPVFIINSLSNETSRVRLCARAVSTRVHIYWWVRRRETGGEENVILKQLWENLSLPALDCLLFMYSCRFLFLICSLQQRGSKFGFIKNRLCFCCHLTPPSLSLPPVPPSPPLLSSS